MQQPLAEILRSPNWLPLRLGAAGQSVTFVRLSEDERRSATFLNERYVSADAPRSTFPLSAFRTVGTIAQSRSHFLFHTSFCGSTVLAHALGAVAGVVGYSEPQILNDLGALAVGGTLPGGLTEVVLDVLCADREGVGHYVIKPTNELNFLLPTLLRARPDARAIFLSSTLDDFLYSIARKGLPGRVWVRGQFHAMKRRTRLTLGFDESEHGEHTDLQIAALVWLQHRALFREAVEQSGHRFVSLTNDVISDRMETTVANAARFLGISLSKKDVHEIAMLQHRDVKRTDARYDPAVRLKEREALKTAVGEEIEVIVRWTSQVAEHAGVATALPPPLA